MARGVNKVILIGNAGADPDVRYTPEGVPVANFSLATSETWKDSSGERQEKTEWHRLVLWRGLAEIAKSYVKKGSKLYVEGKLQTRSWEDQSGQKRYTTEVVVNEMNLLDGRDEGSSQGQPQGQRTQGAQSQQAPPYQPSEGDDDDLPF